MITYWTRNGTDIQYYDYLLGRYNSVDLNMLFLIGYSLATGHSHVSDHIWIPQTSKDANGEERVLDKDFYDRAHRYLDDKYRIDVVSDGFYFDVWAFRYLLEEMGLPSKPLLDSASVMIPEFMRSSDFAPVSLSDAVSFEKPERDAGESDAAYAARVDMAYRQWQTLRKNIAYAPRYQLAEGFLYGLSNLGYGVMPFVDDTTQWYDGPMKRLVQSAADVVHNPVYKDSPELQGSNLFFNWENTIPMPQMHAVGTLAEANRNDFGVSIGGDLFGELEVSDYPDIYRYAYIRVGEGVDVTLTMFMNTSKYIPNVYVSTLLESDMGSYRYMGDFRIHAATDFKRVPVVIVGTGFNSQVRFPFKVRVDPSVQYELPDEYVDAYMEYDLGVIDQIPETGADSMLGYVIAQQSMSISDTVVSDADAVPNANLQLRYRADTAFRVMGVTLPGQAALYGLSPVGIDTVLYARAVPDACFTREQIEAMSESEIEMLHTNAVSGVVTGQHNEYDQDRPNLVIDLSFDLTDSQGMFDIATLIVYARRADGVTIPMAMLSVGDSEVIHVDSRLCRELDMRVKLNDI